MPDRSLKLMDEILKWNEQLIGVRNCKPENKVKRN